tara:strand:- start:442 stop:2061 length:1620 start_codon:yes stop_codon:yes gene_type:complete
MARQAINIGSSANDGTGDPLRTAFDKINDNFVELYGTDNDINTLDANLDVNNNAITTGVTNGDVTITPNGTGSIKLGAMKFVGTTMSSDDSTQITIAENIQTTGTLAVSGAATLSSTLGVTGAATLSSTLSVSGATTMLSGLTATSLTTNTIASNGSNADLSIQPSGTGDVLISALRINGTTLDSSDSTTITIAEGVDVTGALTVGSTAAVTGALTASSTLNVSGVTTLTTTTIDNLALNDNIISSASNADLILSPGGTGKVVVGAIGIKGTTIDSADSSIININEALNVDGNLTVEGTTNTADVATTGNVTVSGSITTGTFEIGDLNIIADGTITSDTNGDIAIDPAGTGAIVLTGPITHTGTQTTTGQLNVDNLRLDGNVLSATSGAITLTPANGQNVTVSGTNVKLTAAEANFTLMEATTARADTIESDTSNADLVFNTQGTGVFDFNAAIKMAEVTKPSAVADHGFIYTKNDSGTGEVFVLDGADNETKISPHNDNGEWEYFSRNSSTGKTVRINMEAMIRDLESFTGNKYIESE